MSLILYLVFGADFLNRSSENEMFGFVYNIRVTDVYRVFITFFISNIEFIFVFNLDIVDRLSLLLKVKTSYNLMLHVTTYSTTRLKISLKVSKQFMEKEVQTRVGQAAGSKFSLHFARYERIKVAHYTSKLVN